MSIPLSFEAGFKNKPFRCSQAATLRLSRKLEVLSVVIAETLGAFEG